MGLICSIFGHRWDCYKCRKCGKKREKEQHDWDGCLCKKCGKIITYGGAHVWNGCTCTRCGWNKDADHLYAKVSGACETVCSVCGKTGEKQHMQHDWDGGKCAKCGITKKDFELIVKVAETMEKMGMTYNDCVRFGYSYTDGYGVRGEIQMIGEVYGSEGVERLLEAIRAESEAYGHFMTFVKESWPELFENCGSVD